MGRHEPSGGFLVASGYGARSQWFRNILEDPRVRFQVGWRRYQGLARPLAPAESGRWLAGYAHRYPRAARRARAPEVQEALDRHPGL